MTQRSVPLRRVSPERLQHQTGEALLRRDFADQAAQDDQLRWWHTRALHGAWGISDGLSVTAALPGAPVVVSPGVAFDLFGRELVLDAPVRIVAPDSADEYLLVLQYVAEDDCRAPSGPCLDSFVAARGVRLVWKLRRTFAPAHGVPLAILNEDNTCPPPFARPHIRPLARPNVGHGVVQLTSRDFSPWIEFYNNEPMQLGWQFEIDTRAGGFTQAPYYFVEIGPRIPDPPQALLFEISRHHVAEVQRDRFTLRYFSMTRNVIGGSTLLYGSINPSLLARFAASSASEFRSRRFDVSIPLRISWIGIEPRAQASSFGRTFAARGIEVNDELHS